MDEKIVKEETISKG